MLPLHEVDGSGTLLDDAGRAKVAECFAKLEAGEEADFTGLTAVQIAAQRNKDGESFLMVASRLGLASMIPFLLEGADIDDSDNDGWTSLLNACHGGFTDVAGLLLDAGASIDLTDLMGWSPILWATYKNRLQTVELLLARKAHANIVGEEDGLTPLIVAAGRGHTDIVHILLDFGVHVNACDKFGSTALIWAARKGYLRIVESLLNAGIEIDAVGMNSCTALILAAKGNYLSVVEAILARDANVNVADYNGQTALSIAAREGYAEVSQALIQSGAFVNTIDNFGNSILSNAVRSGNIAIVRMLLEKYADVNARDSENRTPLHLAIDKSYMDIVLALLEKKPNLEVKNKEGDTPLIRAVKNRDVTLCHLLVNNGAKISTADAAGDNPLHLALRSKSTRLVQTLLVNPSDSKLLYRPNRHGETPYSIDQENTTPILPTIFGPIGGDVDFRNMLGYDAYSDVLADIVCEPNLSLPLMIGLYAKWGSGKSFLLPRIRESMSSFSRSWLDGVELYWSWRLCAVIFSIVAFCFLTISSIVTVTGGDAFLSIYVFVVGLLTFLALFGGYCLMYYGSEVKVWHNAITASRIMARNLARFKLLISVVAFNPPLRTEKDLVVSPVTFLFADDHRLSFIGGEHALANVVKSLYEAAETHYGGMAVRLFSAFKVNNSPYHNSHLRTLCGVPVIVYAGVTVVALSIAFVTLIFDQYKRTYDILYYTPGAAPPTYFVLSMCAFFVAFLVSAFPMYIVVSRALIDPPVRRVRSFINRIHGMPFERMIQKLQREVDAIVALIHTLDAFTNSQTRLVIMIDGLDSCEPSKMLQILDSLVLFFSSRQNLPFIVILAVDPHIVINAINQNSRGSVTASDISGYDYLKNNINMPFYLHQAAIKQLQENLKRRCENLSEWKERNLGRSDTFRESRISLREHSTAMLAQHSRDDFGTPAGGATGGHPVGGILSVDSDMTNMNPKMVVRIVNSMALTGRLLRTFEVDFNWRQLYYWIALIEQWPFRACWLIEKAADLGDDSATLAEVYHLNRQSFPSKHKMLRLDRSQKGFEKFVRKMTTRKEDQLTIGRMKKLVVCTSNLDPFLQKVLIEDKKAGDQAKNPPSDDPFMGSLSQTPAGTLGYAECLFDDPTTWYQVTKPLSKMKIDDVTALLRKLNIPSERLENVVTFFQIANLNGLVLQACDLNELQRQLSCPIGDWTLIKLLIETLRAYQPPPPQPVPVSRSRLQSRQASFARPPLAAVITPANSGVGVTTTSIVGTIDEGVATTNVAPIEVSLPASSIAAVPPAGVMSPNFDRPNFRRMNSIIEEDPPEARLARSASEFNKAMDTLRQKAEEQKNAGDDDDDDDDDDINLESIQKFVLESEHDDEDEEEEENGEEGKSVSSSTRLFLNKKKDDSSSDTDSAKSVVGSRESLIQE